MRWSRKTWIALAVFTLEGYALALGTELECVIPPADRALLLALPYAEFDQTLGQGWRKYGDLGCYLSTATLVDEYMERYSKTLAPWQSRVLRWHAGQLYGFHGDNATARAHFVDSLDPLEPADTPVRWNAYVQATIAFLDKDVKALTHYRDQIARGPTFHGKIANLDVVNRLLKHMDRSYGAAYSDAECGKKLRRS